MRPSQRIISFEREYLNNLVSNKDSSVILQEQEYHLALHPYHLNNLKQSIKDLLGQNIARYDRKLEGILLGYENIKLLSQGTIMDDSCFIHIDVSAKFFVFKPEVGQILVGVVNKKSKDHVGCLLYNTFNVSLPKPESEDVDSWLGTLTEIGNEIKFKIIFLKLQARLPYIRGETVCEEESPKRSKKKKTDLEGVEEETPTKLKKKKKKKSWDVDEEYLPNGFIPDERKKKSKREDSTEKVVEKSAKGERSKKKMRSLEEDNVETPTMLKKKKKKRLDVDEEHLPNGFIPDEQEKESNREDSSEEKVARKSESMDDLLEKMPKKKKRKLDEIEKKSKRRNNPDLHEFEEQYKINLKEEPVGSNDEVAETSRKSKKRHKSDLDINIDNLISNEISKRSHKKKRKKEDDTFVRVYKTEPLDEDFEENIV